MTTSKTSFVWNGAAPCFVPESKYLAKNVDAKTSVELLNVDYSAGSEATEVHSQNINTRRTILATWVHPNYRVCSRTANAPGLFTLPVTRNNDTVYSGNQKQDNRQTLSTRSVSYLQHQPFKKKLCLRLFADNI